MLTFTQYNEPEPESQPQPEESPFAFSDDDLREALAELSLPGREPFLEGNPSAEGPSEPTHVISTELLTREKGLLGDTYKLCTAIPSHKYVASNASDTTSHVFVNGMNGDLVRFLSQLDWLTRRLGQPVTAVINSQRTVIHQYWAALMGILNPALGLQFEYTGITYLKDLLQKNADAGIKTRIFAHSHGAIITRVALASLKKECSKEEWEKIASRCSVVSMGCKLHDWPRDVEVKQYNHTTDSIASLTAKISKLSHPIKTRRSESSELHSEVNIPPWTHSLCHNLYGYVTHFPAFLIAEHTDKNGRVNGEALASSLARSIEQGHFSDSVHRTVIKKMLEAGNEEFARHLIEHSQDGKIGNFQIPYKPAFRELGVNPCL